MSRENRPHRIPRPLSAGVGAGIAGWLGLVLACGALSADARPRSVSGIYPHLAMFSDSGECGTGAVVPWAGRLWVVTYSPHEPLGSPDQLYEITPDLRRVARPESIGGTPANRMIHRESGQLFIGPYAIDAQRRVRAIPYARMFGRPTGNARHLTDPAHRLYTATMEEGLYDVEANTLAVTELWTDEQLGPGSRWPALARSAPHFANLPGYHGKGCYSGQGRVIYANNGEHGAEALAHPDVPSGVLAEWDGQAPAWTIVRRNQFTEVTGPGGLSGNPHPDTDPIWSIGWDHRSLILMLRDRGRWHAYRLPKASHAYDGAHGWNTEWPRIREIGNGDDLLMTMHGSFWRFPKRFAADRSAGIAPRSTYLKVIGDFCRWGDRVVLGCDDTARSEFLNREPLKGELAAPGVSQSNLWFVDPDQLDAGGPPLGRGAVWLDDDVAAGAPSEPYLFAGFAQRSLFVRHETPGPVGFRLEVDRHGDGRWTTLETFEIAARGQRFIGFPPGQPGIWLRLVPDRSVTQATAFFHARARDDRAPAPARRFAGLAKPADRQVNGGVLHARGGGFKTLRLVTRDARSEPVAYDLDGELRLRRTNDPAGAAWTARAAAIPAPQLRLGEGAVVYTDAAGRRWRLPCGDAAFDADGPLGPDRVCREDCTERNLLNAHGTLYELPAPNAGGFARLRPIATHNRRIHDFASYRGLLVLSGLTDDARGEHVVRSDDGRCALWVGTVDDLWTLGKPRGTLGIWRATPVQADVPSDPCLATGYDRKQLTLTHTSTAPVTFRVEADVAGNGQWSPVTRLEVPAGRPLRYRFADAFGAYWLRLVAETDAIATATLVYD